MSSLTSQSTIITRLFWWCTTKLVAISFSLILKCFEKQFQGNLYSFWLNVDCRRWNIIDFYFHTYTYYLKSVFLISIFHNNIVLGDCWFEAIYIMCKSDKTSFNQHDLNQTINLGNKFNCFVIVLVVFFSH